MEEVIEVGIVQGSWIRYKVEAKRRVYTCLSRDGHCHNSD